MRFFIWILALAPLLATETNSCNKKSSSSNCMKGRLEITGICANYVISIIEGPVDSEKVVASWTDPESNKTFTNVFKLGSPCSFPADLKEGDEFYFEFMDDKKEDCAVCMAYRPVPEKANMIRVLESCPKTME